MANFPYQTHLNQVSRSFAFCIAQLPEDLRRPVSSAYLLFRFLDTIEDSTWPSPAQQQQAFDQFLNQLKNPAASTQWEQEFKPASLKPEETQLIKEAEALFLDFSRMPPSVQQVIRQGLENMTEGMRYFAQKEMGPKNLTELNQYCFYVAGIVGELLDTLYQISAPQKSQRSNLVEAVHFGLFLQKINILKDQIQDAKEGRIWVHNREEVEASLPENAELAWKYLDSIPLVDRGYRLFCAWSLFLGLASFSKFQIAFKKNKTTKLSRIETMLLINKVDSLLDKPVLLHQEFQKYFSGAFANLKPSPHKTGSNGALKTPEIMSKYRGQLSLQQMTELSLI